MRLSVSLFSPPLPRQDSKIAYQRKQLIIYNPSKKSVVASRNHVKIGQPVNGLRRCQILYIIVTIDTLSHIREGYRERLVLIPVKWPVAAHRRHHGPVRCIRQKA